MQEWEKTTYEVLEYEFDFAGKRNGHGRRDFLSAGEVINSFSVLVEAGLTMVGSRLVRGDTSVEVRLSGGAIRQRYDVTVRVVTSEGREVERTAVLRIVKRRTT